MPLWPCGSLCLFTPFPVINYTTGINFIALVVGCNHYIYSCSHYQNHSQTKRSYTSQNSSGYKPSRQRICRHFGSNYPAAPGRQRVTGCKHLFWTHQRLFSGLLRFEHGWMSTLSAAKGNWLVNHYISNVAKWIYCSRSPDVSVMTLQEWPRFKTQKAIGYTWKVTLQRISRFIRKFGVLGYSSCGSLVSLV